MEIRKVTDIDTLMRWRVEVIEHVFGSKPTVALMEANHAYYTRNIPDRRHYAVLAVADGVETGCGAICLSEELPSPDNPSGHCAYIMNIYVREAYRGRGIGHAIVRHLLEQARLAGCDKIFLETTAQARTLYKGIGFEELPGIMKYADTQNSKS